MFQQNYRWRLTFDAMYILWFFASSYTEFNVNPAPRLKKKQPFCSTQMNMKFVLFTILNVHVQFHARIQREWEGVQTPSNTGPHPLKMAKPSSQQSLSGHHRHASETSKSGAYNFHACKHVSPVCSCSFVLRVCFCCFVHFRFLLCIVRFAHLFHSIFSFFFNSLSIGYLAIISGLYISI